MNDRWNLDPIYKGFQDPGFTGDMQALAEALQAFADYAQKLTQRTDSLEALREGVALQEKIAVLADKLATYTRLSIPRIRKPALKWEELWPFTAALPLPRLLLRPGRVTCRTC